MFRFVFFSAILIWAQIARAHIDCRALMESTFETFSPSNQLKLTPLDPVTYESNDFVTTRWTDVQLEISRQDDLSLIAKILATGGRLNYEKIFETLTSHLMNADKASVSLIDLTPNIARSYTNTRPSCDKFNCWNATLVWHNPDIPLKYTKPEEIADALNNDYRLLEIGDDLRYGDVIAFRRHKGGALLHTAIYIGDNLVWHKATVNANAPWTFESLTEAMRRSFREEALIKDRRPSLSFYRFRD